MFAYQDLTFEDWMHHIISSIFVAGLGIYMPLGKLPSLANLVMCGIPGAIDYFLLVLVKLKKISSINEKYVNRYLNLILRWPIMFLTSYIFILNIYRNTIYISYFNLFWSLIALILHSLNAIYYCDKVIGNYYLKLNK